MLKIRLQRRGKRNYATYRVVVAEDRAPIKGRYIADVGYYNPHTDEFVVDKDTVHEWLNKGVKASATVHNLLVTHKVITAEKVTSWRPKKKVAEEKTTIPSEAAALTKDAPGEETAPVSASVD
ncbi:MAG: 30S ribosomal protein S16 [Acidobacteriota bacterium]